MLQVLGGQTWLLATPSGSADLGGQDTQVLLGLLTKSTAQVRQALRSLHPRGREKTRRRPSMGKRRVSERKRPGALPSRPAEEGATAGAASLSEPKALHTVLLRSPGRGAFTSKRLKSA